MNVLRILAVFVFGYLMTGCYLLGAKQSLEQDLSKIKTIIRAYPSDSDALCKAPGVIQPLSCHFSLVVEHVEGDLYRGYVNKAVVDAGEIACQRLEKEFQEDDPHFKCPKAEDYQYKWYEFKVEGSKPPADGKAHDFTNIAGTTSLRLDKTVKKIDSPIATPINNEFK